MDEYAIPTLLRLARGSYAAPLRQALAAAGFADLPPHGGRVLARLEDEGRVPLGYENVAEQLVELGYLAGSPLALTERGCRALDVVVNSVGSTDEKLAERIGPEAIATLRVGLGALAEMAAEARPG